MATYLVGVYKSIKYIFVHGIDICVLTVLTVFRWHKCYVRHCNITLAVNTYSTTLIILGKKILWSTNCTLHFEKWDEARYIVYAVFVERHGNATSTECNIMICGRNLISLWFHLNHIQTRRKAYLLRLFMFRKIESNEFIMPFIKYSLSWTNWNLTTYIYITKSLLMLGNEWVITSQRKERM